MSKGPGAVERRIADLLAATRDRALDIGEIADNAYGLDGKPATRAQRLAATRAVHRILKRVRDANERTGRLRSEARKAVGLEPKPSGERAEWRAWHNAVKAHAKWVEAERLWQYAVRIGCWTRIYRHETKRGHLRGETDYWCATTIKGRLYLHPPDVPVQVWAVTITPTGIEWFAAELLRVTERNVTVRYAGEVARLDRQQLWRAWAFYRGVMFVSARTGRIAAELDQSWQDHYAGSAGFAPPPVMQMALAQAIQILGVPLDYTREDVITAFRRAAKRAHPDAGGTAEMFRIFVEARDRLLAAIGAKEKPPKPPRYAPPGAIIRYGTYRPSSPGRLGGSRRAISAR
jgi:hypothetical protein